MRAEIKKKISSFVSWHSEPPEGNSKGHNLPPHVSTLPTLFLLVSLDTMGVPWTVKKSVVFRSLFSNARMNKSLMISLVLTSEYFIKTCKNGAITMTLCSLNDVGFTIKFQVIQT